MLQFNKSQQINTNAVYLETVDTGSGYYDTMVMIYSQSYDNSSGSFAVTATSTPTQYRNWLIFNTSGSDVPSPSGQYDVKLYISQELPSVWQQVATPWDSYNEIWEDAYEDTPTDLLYSDRAYISGSNESNITQYVSADENGTYTTYNG